jgi:(2R)-sulfolactate sulfo-lyase subunit beta
VPTTDRLRPGRPLDADALREISFPAFQRPDGRWGIRNHVVVLPVDDVSNRACELVAASVPGVLAIPHAYGRLQFGADLELYFRTLIGTGTNPNVAAVVVIGIEPGWTERVVAGIAASGKPVRGYSIEGAGDLKTAMLAARCAKDYLQYASELERAPCRIGDLWVSAKCGESDTTTGCASNPTVGGWSIASSPWERRCCSARRASSRGRSISSPNAVSTTG